MTRKSYCEDGGWKQTTILRYSDLNTLVDAVWNNIYEEAQRDGCAEYLEEDEEEIIYFITKSILNAKNQKFLNIEQFLNQRQEQEHYGTTTGKHQQG